MLTSNGWGSNVEVERLELKMCVEVERLELKTCVEVERLGFKW